MLMPAAVCKAPRVAWLLRWAPGAVLPSDSSADTQDRKTRTSSPGKPLGWHHRSAVARQLVCWHRRAGLLDHHSAAKDPGADGIELAEPDGRAHRAWVYHVVEWAGRWSMMDVLLLALMVTLVKLGDLVQFSLGSAVWAFVMCVVMSLIASAMFDPHAIWEDD